LAGRGDVVNHIRNNSNRILVSLVNIRKYREIVEKTLQNHEKLIKEHPFAHSTAFFVYNYLSKGPLGVQ
jgi:hypothetical protein